MTIRDPDAAQQALLVMYAEDMYDRLAMRHKNTLAPPVDARLSANWKLVGYITAVDALADAQRIGLGTRFFYGYLARSKSDDSQFVAVLRGTANPSEWVEDIEFIPIPAPGNTPGMVENGFYSIYGSMRYTPVGSTDLKPVVDGLSTAVGSQQLAVLGHSLGSALATYLSLDLALSNAFQGSLSAGMIASPHTGDDEYTRFFDQKVASYKVYNYSRDLVPRLPILFGYSPLPRAVEFAPDDAEAVIKNTLAGNHHAICYAAMLDYQAANWTAVPKIDKACAACILGPNP